jgi:hypothetical protein
VLSSCLWLTVARRSSSTAGSRTSRWPAKSLTLDEAKALAQEVARALTAAWSDEQSGVGRDGTAHGRRP